MRPALPQTHPDGNWEDKERCMHVAEGEGGRGGEGRVKGQSVVCTYLLYCTYDYLPTYLTFPILAKRIY